MKHLFVADNVEIAEIVTSVREVERAEFDALRAEGARMRLKEEKSRTRINKTKFKPNRYTKGKK